MQRWSNLGSESWSFGGFGRHVTVWAGTKAEWMTVLGNIDSSDEYNEHLRGFLEVANDPGLVGRARPPRHITTGAPATVNFRNTITRAPNSAEKLAFLEALYEMGNELDLWRGGLGEGGAYAHCAERDLAAFIRANQGMYLAHVSQAGQAISGPGVAAVAEQGGSRPTMAMIINAGATAHKGVDLIATANQQTGQARETAHSQAMELIRNSGRTIRSVLEAHDAQVAFQQAVVGTVFDLVWGTIPGGGTLVTAAKSVLKIGLKGGLTASMAISGPANQAEAINMGFVSTCNALVQAGQMRSADAQDAINGFEAVRR